MNKILIVDGNNDVCILLTRFFTMKSYAVVTANTGKAAIDWMKKNTPNIVLCDYKLNDMACTELLCKIKEMHPETLAIICGNGDTKDAVEVMKMGAFDYITKPLFPDEILSTIKKAFLNTATEIVVPDQSVNAVSASKKVKCAYNNQYITGDSPEFGVILKQIDLVAPTNFSVIIYGESGSGKEAIAQQIHQKSRRANKPFIAIDCGALSKELAGSELFGHEKGAFTGALNQKIGNLEIANGGTIFLDEIGNLSYSTQVSLLRVVQERKIRRVGGNKDVELDIRIIIASNENLWDLAKSGKFREDLFHRFNEFSITVPSLHERKQDIMLFAKHFLQLTNTELGKNVKGFTKEVESILNNYAWYGNLRELKNVIKRATLLSDGDLVEAKTLPFEICNFYKLQLVSSGSIIPKEHKPASRAYSFAN